MRMLYLQQSIYGGGNNDDEYTGDHKNDVHPHHAYISNCKNIHNTCTFINIMYELAHTCVE